MAGHRLEAVPEINLANDFAYEKRPLSDMRKRARRSEEDSPVWAKANGPMTSIPAGSVTSFNPEKPQNAFLATPTHVDATS